MNTPDMNTPFDCARAQELLIARSLEDHVEGESREAASALTTHLSDCPACTRFSAVIDGMRLTLAVDEDSSSTMRPDPAVAAALRRRLPAAEPPRGRPVGRWLRGLVGVRIPAYQAALGVAGVAFLTTLFLGTGRPAGIPDVTGAETGVLAVDRPTAIFTRQDTYQVLDKLRMLDRFGGRTQSVDSLFNSMVSDEVDTLRR